MSVISLVSVKSILKENLNMAVSCQIHSYSAVSVEEFLAENEMTVIPHLPYSPDLALCDVFSFP
jgi:hypothetical protein